MIGVYVRARRAHFHSAASDCGLGGDGRSVMPLSQPCVLLAHCVARLGPLCAFLAAACYVLLKILVVAESPRSGVRHAVSSHRLRGV